MLVASPGALSHVVQVCRGHHDPTEFTVDAYGVENIDERSRLFAGVVQVLAERHPGSLGADGPRLFGGRALWSLLAQRRRGCEVTYINCVAAVRLKAKFRVVAT